MKKTLIFFGLLLVASCFDRVNIPVPAEFSQNLTLAVDGIITNEPGPYTVKLSHVIPIGDASPLGSPYDADKVTLFDDAGNSEDLTQVKVGTYQTSPTGMRGTIGREYHIRINTSDGKIFESIPDLMNPVGEVDSIYYELDVTPAGPETVSGENNYGYRIFVDAHSTPTSDNFIRWKFTGTYVVETEPQYYYCPTSSCVGPYCPLPCSGWAYVNGALKLINGFTCTCCRCWVTQGEDKPRLNDDEISANGKFNKVEVGFVPVNFYTFFEKYRVEIVQMSLTKAAHDYWRAVREQKDATGSLYQPITGKIPTNLFEINKSASVHGLFYASALMKKQIYLDRSTMRVEIRVPQDCMSRVGAVGKDCLSAFPGSETTRQQPADWKN